MSQLLEHLISEAKRVPGLTIDQCVLVGIPWNPIVDPRIEQFIAKQADRDLEYDKHGNPVFMPKDEAQKQEIRELWKRIDEGLQCTL